MIEAPMPFLVGLLRQHLQYVHALNAPMQDGVERVIVPQLARSFGISFTAQDIKGGRYFGAKIIPARGAWIEIESDPDGAIYVRIDRKRKFAASAWIK